MKAQSFENGTRILTLNKVVADSRNKTHFFTIQLDDDSDDIAINMNIDNNIGRWLENNCDIEGTPENVALFLELVK